MQDALHLPPAGGVDLRWADRTAADLSRFDLLLETSSQQQESFGGVRDWLQALLPRTCGGRVHYRIQEVLREIETVAPRSAHETPTNPLLNSGMAFAILRRISRESIHTSNLIEGAAACLAEAVHSLGATSIGVMDADLLDRPSLKVLFRLSLTTRPPVQRWTWLFSGDPGREGLGSFGQSRTRLFRYMSQILQPLVDPMSNLPIAADKQAFAGSSLSREGLATDLILQNYDRLLALRDASIELPTDALDHARLLAISDINMGEFCSALNTLREAERDSEDPKARAHLAYLQGLVVAKRRYDLSESDAHHKRGLEALRNEGSSDANGLERAWLHNGLALNQALRWRRDTQRQELFSSAFAHLKRAFSHLGSSETPPAVYLRFNLIANTTFLLEMRGDFKEAARTFEVAFDLEDSPDAATATLGYRIGVLWYRAGNLERSTIFLANAVASSGPSWATREVCLRALGEVSHAVGDRPSAEKAHREGLDLCSAARAKRGFLHHWLALKEIAGSRSVSRLHGDCPTLGPDVENLRATDQSRLRLPSKLPAYVPEVDLENLPTVDLNRFLMQGTEATQPIELEA